MKRCGIYLAGFFFNLKSVLRIVWVVPMETCMSAVSCQTVDLLS